MEIEGVSNPSLRLEEGLGAWGWLVSGQDCMPVAFGRRVYPSKEKMRAQNTDLQWSEELWRENVWLEGHGGAKGKSWVVSPWRLGEGYLIQWPDLNPYCVHVGALSLSFLTFKSG